MGLPSHEMCSSFVQILQEVIVQLRSSMRATADLVSGIGKELSVSNTH